MLRRRVLCCVLCWSVHNPCCWLRVVESRVCSCTLCSVRHQPAVLRRGRSTPLHALLRASMVSLSHTHSLTHITSQQHHTTPHHSVRTPLSSNCISTALSLSLSCVILRSSLTPQPHRASQLHSPAAASFSSHPADMRHSASAPRTPHELHHTHTQLAGVLLAVRSLCKPPVLIHLILRARKQLVLPSR